uniref:Golgin subfamily A member 2 n=1 Tax=Hydra vulgaris TaxID=6087 RepID=T2MDF7_HYDVU
MVKDMSDISRKQKLASAKKKLKKFQQDKSPLVSPVGRELDAEILRGIQNNHIFKTPPIVLKTKNSPENHTQTVSQKLQFTPVDLDKENEQAKVVESSFEVAKPENGTDIFSENSLYSTPLSAKEPTKDEELQNNLASYKRANSILTNQVNEQRKQILILQNKLKNELASVNHLNEQRALKEQLEVHIQTIGILVSEKSELQSSISSLQKKLALKESDTKQLSQRLENACKNTVELEKRIAELQQLENQFKNLNKELAQERDRFSIRLYKVSQEKDELLLESKEMHAKLQMKAEECAILSGQVQELHSRLQNGEIIVQQLTTNSIDKAALSKWQSEKEDLLQLLSEQKSVVQKLVAAKSDLLQKNNEQQGNYDYQIEQLKNKINSLEGEKHTILDKNNDLVNTIKSLQSKFDHQALSKSQDDTQFVTLAKYEEAVASKLNTEKELDIQISENRRLGLQVFEQSQLIEALQSNLDLLQSEASSKSLLLEQIQADKETISRALQQNKALKEQLAELEDGFVRVSNHSAELTGKLEAEQHSNKDIAAKLSEIQLSMEETKLQLATKTSLCVGLEEQVLHIKEELKNVQNKLISREMDLDLSRTELQSVKIELESLTQSSIQHTNQLMFIEKLQEELISAQDAINKLSNHNAHLQDVLNEQRTDRESGNLYPSSGMEDAGEEVASFQENKIEGDQEDSDISWDDVDDGEDSGYPNNVVHFTSQEVEDMQAQLHHLQEERLKVINLLQQQREESFHTNEQLEEHVELRVQQRLTQIQRELQEHFYEQTEALRLKVTSLQEALEIMRKNEDVSDFEANDTLSNGSLKDAFLQLQKRFKSLMDMKAQLLDRIDQLEYMNMKLENETETIGEYVALYQTQRKALKEKFDEKDRTILYLTNEHTRMQNKVSQLHQLVIQLIEERSGTDTKNKELQDHTYRQLTIQSESINDSEKSSLQYNLDNLFGEVNTTPDDELELTKEIQIQPSVNTFHNQTTQKILQLFEQLETTGEGFQHGWFSPAARKHAFTPCKQCSGSLINL